MNIFYVYIIIYIWISVPGASMGQRCWSWWGEGAFATSDGIRLAKYIGKFSLEDPWSSRQTKKDSRLIITAPGRRFEQLRTWRQRALLYAQAVPISTSQDSSLARPSAEQSRTWMQCAAQSKKSSVSYYKLCRTWAEKNHEAPRRRASE